MLLKLERVRLVSKIVYPENETLASIVRNPINDTLQDLKTAQNYCVFTVPKDFAYLGYLRELGGKILGIRQDLVNLSRNIDEIDKSYSATFDALDTYRQSLDLSTLEERDRLIK